MNTVTLRLIHTLFQFPKVRSSYQVSMRITSIIFLSLIQQSTFRILRMNLMLIHHTIVVMNPAYSSRIPMVRNISVQYGLDTLFFQIGILQAQYHGGFQSYPIGTKIFHSMASGLI